MATSNKTAPVAKPVAKSAAGKKPMKLSDPNSGKSWDLPVISGSVGPDVLDVRKLYADTGAFTYDPGFTSTASCPSKITFIDGDEGILLHRGYDIAELAEKSDFMEVAYLLLKGELPNEAALLIFAVIPLGESIDLFGMDLSLWLLRISPSASSIFSPSLPSASMELPLGVGPLTPNIAFWALFEVWLR